MLVYIPAPWIRHGHHFMRSAPNFQINSWIPCIRWPGLKGVDSRAVKHLLSSVGKGGDFRAVKLVRVAATQDNIFKLTHTHIYIQYIYNIYIQIYIYTYINMIILWYILYIMTIDRYIQIYIYINMIISWRTPSKTWERVLFLNPQTNGTCLKEFPEIVSFVTKPICWAVRIEPLDLSGPVRKQVMAVVVHVSRKPVLGFLGIGSYPFFVWYLRGSMAWWATEKMEKPQKYWQNGTGQIDKVTNVSKV